jgi:hypothetical protein
VVGGWYIIIRPGGEYDDLGGRAPLDVVVGVDSLDVFMLTGLTLDIPGCSPPSRARFSPTMHALYGFT